MERTISTWLSLQKSLKSRLTDLRGMKNDNSHRFIYSSRDEIKEPVYDIKEIDKKCAKIEMAIFKIDGEIKRMNAETTVDIDVDYENLMTPIE